MTIDPTALRDTFDQAASLPPAEREAFLVRACRNDSHLREQVERLLRADVRAGAVFDTDGFAQDSSARARREPSLSSGALMGPYVIVAPLGAGGMGEVYKARDTRLNRTVALKVLPRSTMGDSSARQRFDREARTVAALSHPHICPLFDIGHHDGIDFLVMEYLDGETLAARLAGGGLPLDDTLRYAAEIADALAAAHRASILHRDLKPGNIMLTSAGAKLLDFGLAKLVERATADEGMTVSVQPTSHDGTIVGTPAYMSPEQAQGKPLDSRSDIFSFGAVLYEMATGSRAFRGDSPAAVLSSILRDEPRPAGEIRTDLPGELSKVISQCLSKDPSRRPASMSDVGVLLKGIAEGRPGAGDRVGRRLGTRRTRRRALALGAAGLVALAVIGLTGIVWRERAGDAPASDMVSIVALPSDVYGPEELRYLSDAVPATLSTHLSQVAGVETKVPPSSVEVEQAKGDLARVADAYNVTAFVLSSVTAERDRLVLNLQLVEPRTRRVSWSQQYTGDRSSYVDLVNRAAEGLRLALRPTSASVRVPVSPERSSEAELALRRGQYYSNRYNNFYRSGDFDIASGAFQKAIDLDQTLDEAAAEMAQLHLMKVDTGVPFADTVPDAERWARRSLEINKWNAKAWCVLAWVEHMQAGASQRRIIEYAIRSAAYGPRCARCQASLAVALAPSADLQIAVLQSASRLAPLEPIHRLNLAEVYRTNGRVTEALRLLDDALEAEPELVFGLHTKVFVLADLDRLDEAAAIHERLKSNLTEKGTIELELRFQQHTIARGLGQTQVADQLLDSILSEVNASRSSSQYMNWAQIDLVPVLARSGRAEKAIQILTSTTEAGAIPGYSWLLNNPRLGPLRSDPRVQSVMARARVQFDEMLAAVREARSRGELPEYLERPLNEVLARSDRPAER